jgi:hypothetical protein
MGMGSQESRLRALGCVFTSRSRGYGAEFVVLRIPRRVRGPKRALIRRVVWDFCAFLGHRPRVLCGRSGRVLCGVRVWADV